ncbi:MAG: hypothetical protein OXH04_15155, partial [Acidobacteria bacterium]|nr:hypothetical protein [Acidobacteriota bacterium]
MHRFPSAAFPVLLAALFAAVALAPPAVEAQSPADVVPVTDAMLREPAPEDWPMWRRTHDGWGYS